ncbi:MAG: YggS family pyridoxal phosphate-dependent enzyme [Peptostreptococcaceae bacterium]|nr:YggS family pyridoxal phosphate-dependent enzyme [Peptostreptococcaceae bacterium]
MNLEKNYTKILSQIEDSLKNSRFGQKVDLVAVTKTISPKIIDRAIGLGVEHIAENRVQEIRRKYTEVTKSPTLKWHQIGSLQTNKVKYIIDKVELIHSLDRYDLAKEIDRQAKKFDKLQRCLVQVKISEEESKQGADKADVLRLVSEIKRDLPNIVICGLMGMAPYYEDPERSRKYFAHLRRIFEEIKESGLVDQSFEHLSMGMSNDFRVAIEEGSTMVRIGSALFSEADLR